MKNCAPSFAMTDAIVDLVIDIGELAGKVPVYGSNNMNSDMQRLNPYSVEDLRKAHKMMMSGPDAGTFRTGNEGIYSGDVLVHAGFPAAFVPGLMQELLSWLEKSKMHPLLKACIFYYEFELIRPFEKANDAIGRLWQSLILQEWKECFSWLPIESRLQEKKEAYCSAMNSARAMDQSNIFVEFMLETIRDTMSGAVQ